MTEQTNAGANPVYSVLSSEIELRQLIVVSRRIKDRALTGSSETFLRLSATAWSAIASIVGSLSLIAVGVFNVLYLKAARAQAEAANQQAAAANNSVAASKASNELAKEAIHQSQRPWVGLAPNNAVMVGAISVDSNGAASAPHVIQVMNYGDAPAQAVLVTAQLMITEDLADLALEEERLSHPNGDKTIGSVLFPKATVGTSSASTFPSAKMKSRTFDHLFEAWLVGSIRYRDRYGNHYHTTFRYWMVNPESGMKPFRFSASPDSQYGPLPFLPNGVAGKLT